MALVGDVLFDAGNGGADLGWQVVQAFDQQRAVFDGNDVGDVDLRDPDKFADDVLPGGAITLSGKPVDGLRRRLVAQ
jgi:hypothetical protein